MSASFEERIQLIPDNDVPFSTTCFSSSSAIAAMKLWKDAYQHPSTLINYEQSLVQFYQNQNDLIQQYAIVSGAYTPFTPPHQSQQVSYAIYLSNAANLILLLTQAYVAFASFSLSMMAVLIDALLDTVSGAVIFMTWYWRSKRDITRYPVGRARLEPLGVIALACLMTAATLLSLEQSLVTLLAGSQHTKLQGFSFFTASLLLFALFVKACLFLYCRTVDHDGVQALAQDHANDCLANSVSFLTVLIAQHAVWWIDPLGGIVISCLIIRNWYLHTIQHFDRLLGRIAHNQILNLITFITFYHSEKISLVDTVRAYHVGSGIYAEVDIVLPANMPLKEAHDVGESLQKRIEEMDQIERCFVHLDTEALHAPTMEHKQI